MKAPLRTYHLVADYFYPFPGGLAMSTYRIARFLAQEKNTRVNIYIRSQEQSVAPPDPSANIVIRSLPSLREDVEGPLSAGGLLSTFTKSSEWHRLDYLSIKSIIEEELASHGGKHRLLSFGISSCGFVAQQVSLSLGVPHVVSVRGNDFSSHFFDPLRLSCIEYVAKRANLIVTTNEDQRRMIISAFGVNSAIVKRIHSGLSYPAKHSWSEQRGHKDVRLYSDCGYSYKKGTHILLEAFRRVAELFPVTLRIVGSTEPEREQYWHRYRKNFLAEWSGKIFFEDHVSPQQAAALLSEHDLYCSATLGEGCSQARIGAMSSGIPIVTTDCGEVRDLVLGVPHVFTAPPGDVGAFTDKLKLACSNFLNGRLSVDLKTVAQWQDYFQPEREMREWKSALSILEQ
jgi:glycosyltransferase involved in cell wall biosynthesis